MNVLNAQMFKKNKNELYFVLQYFILGSHGLWNQPFILVHSEKLTGQFLRFGNLQR